MFAVSPKAKYPYKISMPLMIVATNRIILISFIYTPSALGF